MAKIRINVGIEGCVHGGSLILPCITEIFHYKKFFLKIKITFSEWMEGRAKVPN